MFRSTNLIPLALLMMLLFVPPAISQGTISVTATTNKSTYLREESISVYGSVSDSSNNPLQGATVSIEVDDPKGTPAHVQILYSSASGTYSDSFTLSAAAIPGVYVVYVSASKSGYSSSLTQTQFQVMPQTTGTTSSSQTGTQPTTTNPPTPRCVIATAAYGSELAPEVALLRNFRDSMVLETSAGRSFMLAFNSFYYSFAPLMTSFIASHSEARTATRLALSPLLGILNLSGQIFAVFSFNPEIAVSISGFFASFAIGAVYLGPWLILVFRFSKRATPERLSRLVRIVAHSCVVSMAGITLAEITQLSVGLVITTVATVLAFLVLGGLLTAFSVTRTWHGNSTIPRR